MNNIDPMLLANAITLFGVLIAVTVKVYLKVFEAPIPVFSGDDQDAENQYFKAQDRRSSGEMIGLLFAIAILFIPLGSGKTIWQEALLALISLAQ